MTGTHCPLEQPVPAPHTVPHAPQLLSSSALLTQAPPHADSGAGHDGVHPPETQ
jgi:hypothetical protein